MLHAVGCHVLVDLHSIVNGLLDPFPDTVVEGQLLDSIPYIAETLEALLCDATEQTQEGMLLNEGTTI